MTVHTRKPANHSSELQGGKHTLQQQLDAGALTRGLEGRIVASKPYCLSGSQVGDPYFRLEYMYVYKNVGLQGRLRMSSFR